MVKKALEKLSIQALNCTFVYSCFNEMHSNTISYSKHGKIKSMSKTKSGPQNFGD